MRIIGGALKGKSINFLKNLTTRPLKDSVKENIFNILKHSNLINIRIENSNILDLYSGIGSFGLEGLSRGAKRAIFIEQNKEVANILKENLNKLSLTNKTLVFEKNIENVLADEIKEKFNIFFLDPPFADNEFIYNLDLIKKRKLYETKHIVIIHRESKTKDDLNNFIKTIIIKKYGRSKIIFGAFT
jgi:16S rRNA (guanine966-N2)-methyltransferase